MLRKLFGKVYSEPFNLCLEKFQTCMKIFLSESYTLCHITVISLYLIMLCPPKGGLLLICLYHESHLAFFV